MNMPLCKIFTSAAGAGLIKIDRISAAADLTRITAALYQAVRCGARFAVLSNGSTAITLAAIDNTGILGALAPAKVDAFLDGHVVPGEKLIV